MTDDKTLEQIASDIEEVKKWNKIQGLESLARILESLDDAELVMFNTADGDKTVREIADVTGVSTGFVSGRMKVWSNLGIVEKDGRQWKHLAPLKTMGIEVPDLDDD